MSKKVLIDASQEKEIRLVVSDNGEITDINLQGLKSDQNRGNVYLAKVSRVEPSLQAVFIDYGDDEKNGFLPFVEIHPSNFQISSEEKEKLLEKLHKLNNKQAEGVDPDDERKNRQRYYEILSGYKAQEVIKKDQVLLVQVTKERRGNKGAAFTTYLSIPGRFCVFMPNSLHQGGISKKITDSAERNRLKSLLTEFHEKYDNQASVVMRTACECKTKVEIRRDFDYTKKIWENIKKHTLGATAPCFIYKEADIIKQSIRDLYQSEIEEVIVSGKNAFKDTVAFMQLLLPRHVDKVKEYKEAVPIFAKYNVEEQINNLYENEVTLRSGGHIVIQSTEALTSVDVNSGRYTDERNVENTALRTNVEAAKEVAKQIMLRSISGLIVIDFIDMKNEDNKVKVEKELRHAFAEDRAKVVMAKIGKFGLLELSRQRIKQPFLEANTTKCSSCEGRGIVRRSGLTNASIIRNLDYFLSTQKSSKIKVIAAPTAILLLMQYCKRELLELEEKYHVNIAFEQDNSVNAEIFYIEQVSRDQNEKKDSALSESDEAQYGEESYQQNKDSTHKKSRGRSKFSSRENSSNDMAKNTTSGGEKVSEETYGNSESRAPKRQPRSNKRRIEHGKRVDKLENLPNTNAESESKPSVNDKNNSLLKDIWRKIID